MKIPAQLSAGSPQTTTHFLADGCYFSFLPVPGPLDVQQAHKTVARPMCMNTVWFAWLTGSISIYEPQSNHYLCLFGCQATEPEK